LTIFGKKIGETKLFGICYKVQLGNVDNIVNL
jgi:hypothetical protein